MATAQTCTYFPACTDTSPACNPFGQWPLGTIYYKWTTGTEADYPNSEVRKAMNDWENLTDHIIRFQQTTVSDTADSPTRVKIQVLTGSGGSMAGYNHANAKPHHVATDAWLGVASAYHELGHLIGLTHEWQRNDRNKYVIIEQKQHCSPPGQGSCGADGYASTNCTDPNNTIRCSAQPPVGRGGPYDYESTMQYNVTHPDFTRWDQSPIVPNTACNGVSDGTLPPQCSNTSCMTTACSPLGTGWTPPTGFNLSYVCPTCNDCRKLQPTGLPTRDDAAAVVEMYESSFFPSWKQFARTVNDDGTNTPYNNLISAGVKIAQKSSPAIETWEGGSLGIYVLADDQHLYQRYKTTVSPPAWSTSWIDHGCCFNSDPAVVSWASGRSDLVVRATGTSGTIKIKSYTNGAWTGWGSLGTPTNI
jgi:hypothetical protein